MQEAGFLITCPRCGGTDFGFAGSPHPWRNGRASRSFEPSRIVCLDCLDAAERKATQQPAPPNERSAEALGNERPASEPGDVV